VQIPPPHMAHIGEGSINMLSSIMGTSKGQRVFLVTGKASFEQSGVAAALAPLLATQHWQRFCSYTENPKLEEIVAGIAAYRACQPDWVIAAGGGSAIDVAKAITLLAQQDHEAYADILQGKRVITPTSTPLIAIPTTAGTGSEATHFAVVYIGHHKYSLAHPSILPRYAIIDPQFLYSASATTTASCGLDALTQAIESWWAVSSTEESRHYSLGAIQRALPALPNAVRGDRAARAILGEAAYLAGKAINIAKTTAAHALSYAITSFHGIPHGHAVALTLPYFFAINTNNDNAPVTDPRGAAHLQHVMREIFHALGVDSAAAATTRWIHLMEAVGLAYQLDALGITHEAALANIIANVNLERLSNHPVKLTPELLRNALLQPLKR
jgi:alcohol dehydrogenase